jgi:hypothetical protein
MAIKGVKNPDHRSLLCKDSDLLRSLVGWKCPKCDYSMVGFLLPTESAVRQCSSWTAIVNGKRIPGARIRKNGKIVPYVCGEIMIVVTDERKLPT